MARERTRRGDDDRALGSPGSSRRRRNLRLGAYILASLRSSQRAVVGAARKLAPTLGLVLLGASCLLVVVVVEQLHEPPTSRAQYELIAYFQAKQTDPATRTVHFEWGFRREYQGDVFTCTLDVDANRIGIVEQSIADCDEQTTTSWSYEEPGTYEAALVATRRAGGSDRALVTVRVGNDATSGPFGEWGRDPTVGR